MHELFKLSNWDFCLHWIDQSTNCCHVLIQTGGGGGGTGCPDPPLENYKNIGFLSNTGLDPLKSQSYQSSIQCWAIIGPPVKCHLNGPLLVGRWWPPYSGIWILHPLINLKKALSKLDPLRQNFLISDKMLPWSARFPSPSDGSELSSSHISLGSFITHHSDG